MYSLPSRLAVQLGERNAPRRSLRAQDQIPTLPLQFRVPPCLPPTDSAGGNQDPCLFCGEGYNTSAAADPTVADVGADSHDLCAIDFGWHTDTGVTAGLAPCVQGYYK